MLRIDGRVLVAAVVGVFVAGTAVGFVVAGLGGGAAATADPTPTSAPSTPPTATPADGPDATSTPGSPSTVTTTVPPTDTQRPTASATAPAPATTSPAPTTAPTPLPVPTRTTASPETSTRTPMLVRRFDVDAIEHELRRLLNDWRERRGLQPFTNADGTLVGDLNAMAADHSAEMADVGRLAHTIDGRSSADRYHEYDVYWNCVFDADHSDYVVTPDDNDLEVLARTYAGVTYETVNSTDYNANETAVAEDVFEFWMANARHRERLAERNASRIGIGIETTRDNEVYVTGNLCGS